MDDFTLIIAVIGCIVGVSSLILGIHNLRRATAKDKITITITPIYYETPSGERSIALEVVNVGFRPTVIRQLGFDMRDGRIFLAKQPHELDTGSLSDTLHPQSRLVRHFHIGADISEEFQSVYQSFAMTVSGQKFTGEPRPRQNNVTIHRYS